MAVIQGAIQNFKKPKKETGFLKFAPVSTLQNMNTQAQGIVGNVLQGAYNLGADISKIRRGTIGQDTGIPQGFLGNQAQIFQQAGQNISEASQRQATGQQGAMETSFQQVGQAPAVVGKTISNIFGSALSTVASPELKQTGGEVIQNIFETAKGKKALEVMQGIQKGYEGLSPRTQANLAPVLGVGEIGLNLAPLPGAGKVGQVIGKGLEKAPGLVGAGAKKLPGLVKPVGKVGEKIGGKTQSIATKVSTKANRFNALDEQKFIQTTGQTPGEFAVNRGMTEVGEPAVKKATENFITSMKQADDAFEQIGGNYKYTGKGNDPLKLSLDDLEKRLINTESNDLARIQFLKNKYETEGLTFPEINELKRAYSNNFKYGFEDRNSEALQRSSNIQNKLREWQFEKANEMGLQNIREINKNTQAWKLFADSLEKKLSRSGANNAVSITDWIALSGGNLSNIALFAGKKLGTSDYAKKLIIKALGKKTKEPIIKPDINKPQIKGLLPKGPVITPAPEMKSGIKITDAKIQPKIIKGYLEQGKIVTPQTKEKAIIQESKYGVGKASVPTTKGPYTPQRIDLKRLPPPKNPEGAKMLDVNERRDKSIINLSKIPLKNTKNGSNNSVSNNRTSVVMEGKLKKPLTIKKVLTKPQTPFKKKIVDIKSKILKAREKVNEKKSLKDTTDYTKNTEPQNIDIDRLPKKGNINDKITKELNLAKDRLNNYKEGTLAYNNTKKDIKDIESFREIPDGTTMTKGDAVLIKKGDFIYAKDDKTVEILKKSLIDVDENMRLKDSIVWKSWDDFRPDVTKPQTQVLTSDIKYLKNPTPENITSKIEKSLKDLKSPTFSEIKYLENIINLAENERHYSINRTGRAKSKPITLGRVNMNKDTPNLDKARQLVDKGVLKWEASSEKFYIIDKGNSPYEITKKIEDGLGIGQKYRIEIVKIVSDFIKKEGAKRKEKIGDLLDEIASKIGAKLNFINDKGTGISGKIDAPKELIEEARKYKSADEFANNNYYSKFNKPKVDWATQDKKRFSYKINCVDCDDGDKIGRMVDFSSPVTYNKLKSVIGEDNLKQTFPDYKWDRGDGGFMKMKDDWHINYDRGVYEGEPAYFVTHSGIEYVFTNGEKVGDINKLVKSVSQLKQIWQQANK